MMRVFLSRKEYDATLPWSAEAHRLREMAVDSYPSLAGFAYLFRDVETAHAFEAAVYPLGELAQQATARAALAGFTETVATELQSIALAVKLEPLVPGVVVVQASDGTWYTVTVKRHG